MTSAALRRAQKIHHVTAIQAEYSAFVLDIENEGGSNLLQTCCELGVAVVCYSPLGRGLLTSTFKDGAFGSDPTDARSKVFPRLVEANRETNMKLVGQFAALAEKKGCNTSQMALAWLLKQGDDIFSIPETKKINYLEENWRALDVVSFDADEVEIRKFVESADIAGHRLPDTYMENNVLVTTKEEEA